MDIDSDLYYTVELLVIWIGFVDQSAGLKLTDFYVTDDGKRAIDGNDDDDDDKGEKEWQRREGGRGSFELSRGQQGVP